MKVITIFSLLYLSHLVVAFVPPNSRTSFDRPHHRFISSKPLCSEAESSSPGASVVTTVSVSEQGDGLADVLVATRRTGIVGFIYSSIAGLYTGLGGYVAQGIASEETIEMAELPPPYIPAIFGVFLLAGVGILTSTLGNVMDEGTPRNGDVQFRIFYVPASQRIYCRFYRHCPSSNVDHYRCLCGGVFCHYVPFPEHPITEASLGLQSGARARKEIERSRSSYFKK
jgi:hypothetical protein